MSNREDGDCANRPDSQENRRRFLQKAGADPARAVALSQVHGNGIILVDESHAGTIAGEADGLITQVPGLPLCIGAADCVPVIIYSSAPRALAALHSGRESTYLNIAAEAVSRLEQEAGCRVESLHVQIGPCICGDHYEVSEEIAERFRALGYGGVHGRMLDLPAIITQQFLNRGVPEQQIHRSNICTYGDGHFYSFRRDNTPERNVAVAML